MRFCSLGSGSSGNATLVEYADQHTTTRILLDCGMPLKVLSQRLLSRGLGLAQLDAVFVTHEHSDHIGCARQLATQCGIPVWMSRGTYAALGQPDLQGKLRFAKDGEVIPIADLVLHPFSIPHDAKEPLQVVVASPKHRLGLLTDLGHVSRYVLENVGDLDALILECNHDPALLQASQYPPFLKARVGGNYGHLSNQQAMDCLASVASPRLQHVIAAHLSEQNNQDMLVLQHLEALKTAHQHAYNITIANACEGFDWIAL